MSSLAKLTAEIARVPNGSEAVVTPYKDGVAVIVASHIAGGVPDIDVKLFAVERRIAADTTSQIGRDNVIFVTPPAFMVAPEYGAPAVHDIAPALVALWQAGAGNVFDEMCLYCADGQLGMAAIAVEAEILATTGQSVEFDHAYASRTELGEWGNAMAAADNPLFRKIGKQIGKSIRHFMTHDLEGNSTRRNSM